MKRRIATIAVLAAGTAAFAGTTTAAAGGPPPPTSSNGNPVHLVASGLGTPTAFAFGGGTVFESDAGSGSSVPGGVYVLSHGTAKLVPGSPKFSFGVVWHKGTLYVSAGSKLLAWSGWNGTKFAKQRTFYKAPKQFPGFNGLAFGANGRLYAGVDVGRHNDHGPATAPYQYDVLSFDTAGGKPQIVAKGIRQPWQLAFPTGSNSPFVSDLGQDSGATNPPDFLLRVKQGQNYGFPKCNWTVPSNCKGDAKPFRKFTSHTDVMGVAINSKRLYLSEFGCCGGPPQVVSMPMSGGKVKPLLTGFVAPIVGLGIHNGVLYVGDLAGDAWRVKL